MGAEEENDNTCEKEGAGTKGEEERSISAPLVLSQERMEEVCRRLLSLEEQIKRLQVRGGEQRQREIAENIERNCKQGAGSSMTGADKDERHNKRWKLTGKKRRVGLRGFH